MANSDEPVEDREARRIELLADQWGVPAPGRWRTRARQLARYCWPFHPHFERSLKSFAEASLKRVGAPIPVVGAVVLFRLPSDEDKFEICVSPEFVWAIDVSAMERLEIVTGERFWGHEDLHMFHADPRTDEMVRRSRLNRIRGDCLAAILGQSEYGRAFHFLAGYPAKMGEFDAYPIIGIDADLFGNVERLRTTRKDRFDVTGSLFDGVLAEVLRSATSALYRPEPGSSLGPMELLSPEIAVRAAARVTGSAFLCAGDVMGAGADENLTAVAALPYEGRPGRGRIIISRPDHPNIAIRFKLNRPVRFSEVRAMRKLLEVSGPDLPLIAFEREAIGYGELVGDIDESAEDIFQVDFRARGAWSLYGFKTSLLTVIDGVPRIPEDDLDLRLFRDVCERRIPGANVGELQQVVEAAKAHTHGAMVVISNNAPAEVDRLSVQALKLEPVVLSDADVVRFTEIDGAIMLDGLGRCHGVGVLLDGVSRLKGDPARGSRYNNAIRYLDSDAPAAVIVVYSSDGSIDILPAMPRRIRPSAIIEVIGELERLAGQNQNLANSEGSEDNGSIRRLPPRMGIHERVRQIAFYLNEGDCAKVNAALKKIHDHEVASGLISIVPPVYAPHPDMDEDVYFLPEEEA